VGTKVFDKIKQEMHLILEADGSNDLVEREMRGQTAATTPNYDRTQ